MFLGCKVYDGIKNLNLLCRCPDSCSLQPKAITHQLPLITGLELQFSKQVICSHITIYAAECYTTMLRFNWDYVCCLCSVVECFTYHIFHTRESVTCSVSGEMWREKCSTDSREQS